ncbi:MAG: glycosyltransferase family 4 protein [Bacteroidales bacterium]|nr:glycosyltransferase family 4 protein [Bacteroidales bacterium]
MKILFLMIAYPNVEVNTSMYTDLTQEFYSNGNDVSVAVANGPKETTISIEQNINVLRVKTFELFNTSFIMKGLANLILPFQISMSIEKYYDGVSFDALIVPTPPVTYLQTLKKIRRKYNAKIYLILRDIFPQNAIDLGIIRNPFLKAYFRRQEKKLYAISDYIGCMSQGNISYIKEHNPEIKTGKLHLLPNWKNVSMDTNPDATLKSKYGLDNKFIALYGGNLGRPQQIDFILELAIDITYLDDVVFLIIGEGTEKKRIMHLVHKMNLKNVIIKDSLPRSQYHELVKVCDIGLINLDGRFTIPNIPSRTLAYWEAKIPILAAIDRNTDFNNLLEESGSGLWSITGDLKSYKGNFERLYKNKDLRTSMGENGYSYLRKNCTAEKAFQIINEKLKS